MGRRLARGRHVRRRPSRVRPHLTARRTPDHSIPFQGTCQVGSPQPSGPNDRCPRTTSPGNPCVEPSRAAADSRPSLASSVIDPERIAPVGQISSQTHDRCSSGEIGFRSVVGAVRSSDTPNPGALKDGYAGHELRVDQALDRSRMPASASARSTRSAMPSTGAHLHRYPTSSPWPRSSITP